MSWFEDWPENWPDWTREPLVHFLLAGALIFVFFTWRGEPLDPNSRAILIDRDVQAELSVRFERTLGRSPTDVELDQQIAQYVRDEVLYREALRLGLDQGDAVVRRRLVNKMDLAASVQAEATTPSEATLREWFDANADRYSGAPKFTFDQLYFSQERDALSALTELPVADDWAALGEPISLPATLDQVTPREIEARFGVTFAERLGAMQSGEDWQAPVQSGFGWHVVRLRERSEDITPAIEDIREQVENDWRSATIAARKDAAYQLLRDAYRIEVNE